MTTSLKMTTLDCADPRAEAAFWSELLGWAVVAAEDEYAMLLPPDGGPPWASDASRATRDRAGRTRTAPSSSTSISAARTSP